jgi:hypothetical protein
VKRENQTLSRWSVIGRFSVRGKPIAHGARLAVG